MSKVIRFIENLLHFIRYAEEIRLSGFALEARDKRGGKIVFLLIGGEVIEG
ncbi:hypothetical protein TMA_084 [Thermus phage TMA]|uniref:hypothetical protein n=1 Tax=Thermus phage TMA TaxID=699370 RepID=UPI00021AADC5|nr:hypothetical protein TMA_084 [Thermus phage TMA]BAK53772.1 hypothetical protein TMA_084 [Thermus phage TMA]